MTPPNPPTPPGTDRAQAIRALEGAAAYFDKGRCSGHAQFNGRYCRDVAGPDRWCIHCAGFMLLDQLRAAQRERSDARLEMGKEQTLRAITEARITELESALRTAQSWIDAAVKACAARGCSQKEYESARVQRERAEQAESRITELESALQDRASSGATTERIGGHIYDSDNTSDCHNGCGCWMGPSSSGGPDGLDPFGDCPKSAPPVATTGGETDYAAIARHVEAVQTNLSATLRQTGSNGDDAPDDYCALSSAIVALRRAAKAAPVATTGPDEPAALTELRRVVAASLAHNKGGQQVGPMSPGRMPPSMAKCFQQLLDAELSSHSPTPAPDAPTRG